MHINGPCASDRFSAAQGSFSEAGPAGRYYFRIGLAIEFARPSRGDCLLFFDFPSSLRSITPLSRWIAAHTRSSSPVHTLDRLRKLACASAAPFSRLMSTHSQLIRAVRIDYRMPLVAPRIILALKARFNQASRSDLKLVPSVASGILRYVS